ncbi:MAG: aminoglycoside phosphotransferase family protein [Desulfobacterales bacterium]
MKTFSLFILYSITIFMEKYFYFLIPISFDRSTSDLKKSRKKIINNVREKLSIREVDSAVVYSVVGNETGKDQYVTGLELSYRDQENQPHKRNLAVKYLSSRNEPLYLSSLKSAVLRGLNQEVTFYNELSGRIPFVTPECIFADSIPLLYRGIIIMEKLNPDFTVDDYLGCLPDQSMTVIKNISLMHAKFWNRILSDPSLNWLPGRQNPLDLFWFLNYITKKEKACVILWEALYKHFARHPITVAHGDCRPGNIMWFDNGSIAMLDWQFAHAGIGTWDATYYIVMAHDIKVRKENEFSLIAQYYSDLSVSYKKFHSEELPYSEKQCMEDHQILKLLLGLYGWAALVSHMFDKYGNDPRDVRSWADRITSAINDLDSDFISGKIKIPARVIDDFKTIMDNAGRETKERFIE